MPNFTISSLDFLNSFLFIDVKLTLIAFVTDYMVSSTLIYKKKLALYYTSIIWHWKLKTFLWNFFPHRVLYHVNKYLLLFVLTKWALYLKKRPQTWFTCHQRIQIWLDSNLNISRPVNHRQECTYSWIISRICLWNVIQNYSHKWLENSQIFWIFST